MQKCILVGFLTARKSVGASFDFTGQTFLSNSNPLSIKTSQKTFWLNRSMKCKSSHRWLHLGWWDLFLWDENLSAFLHMQWDRDCVRFSLRTYLWQPKKCQGHIKVGRFLYGGYIRVVQKGQILPNWKIQLSLGIFELFGSKAFTKIFFENFRARLALPLSHLSFRDLLIKPKNKSVQITPKMKSWGLYHV